MSLNPLLVASRSPGARRVAETFAPARRVADRFVAGHDLDAALGVAQSLVGRGLQVTVDVLGEDTADAAAALAARDEYLRLLEQLAARGYGGRVEVSLKLSAFGQALPVGGEELAEANARTVCEAAAATGTTVTLDMEDHPTVDSTLAIASALRQDFPWVGSVVQSMLHRTEADCAALAEAGARVRLVKGAYAEPASVAHRRRADIDAAYRRCLEILLAGRGYPMIATHDPALITATLDAAGRLGRPATGLEFQMLHGIRADEQERLAAQGHQVRVYLPYGTDWYAYFMRRLAERPANLLFFLRALTGR